MQVSELFQVALGLLLGLGSIAGWITHVIVCIQTSQWILLVIGALFFPVGIIHGIGTWFGLFG